jgi:hypothetical protein
LWKSEGAVEDEKREIFSPFCGLSLLFCVNWFWFVRVFIYSSLCFTSRHGTPPARIFAFSVSTRTKPRWILGIGKSLSPSILLRVRRKALWWV